jgi:DNA polymerase III subunit epsilon
MIDTRALREIVFDTETTGTDFRNGDRVIEIGCIELLDRRPTGREFHAFLQPDRAINPDAMAVHGITDEQLIGKPRFPDVMKDFLTFIGDAPLVAHNAQFDFNFINMELQRCGAEPLDLARMVDTLQLARKKYPAGPNSLDALCKRFEIDASKRDKHGAIIDSLLLAQVYVELLGEKQASLALMGERQGGGAGSALRRAPAPQRPTPLPSRVTDDDRARHQALIKDLGETAAWRRYRLP